METEDKDEEFGSQRKSYYQKDGWRSNRGYGGQGKRRNWKMNMKRDNYPTIELPDVDTKLSYREYVLKQSESITITKAEQGYERYVCLHPPTHQLFASPTKHEQNALFRRLRQSRVAGGVACAFRAQALAAQSSRGVQGRIISHHPVHPRRQPLRHLHRSLRRLSLPLPHPQPLRRAMRIHPFRPPHLHARLPPPLPPALRRVPNSLLRRRVPLSPDRAEPTCLRSLRLTRSHRSRLQANGRRPRAARRHRDVRTQRTQTGRNARRGKYHLHPPLLALETNGAAAGPRRCRKWRKTRRKRLGADETRFRGFGDLLGRNWDRVSSRESILVLLRQWRNGAKWRNGRKMRMKST